MAISCARPAGVARPAHKEMNAVYYWKTVFAPDSADRAFIVGHYVGRLYLRMFDVTRNPENSALTNRAIPNATVKIGISQYDWIDGSLKHLELVPVIYITTEALDAMKGHEGVLASNIVTRVRNMCQYNELPNVKELQLDCDWTSSLEDSYFKLCDSVKLSLDSLKLPWQLSSTVRLHQLARKAPPVDCGVLMVYNTGSFDNPDARNSILDAADVEPYLKHLKGYPLHLDVAYPTYSWQLLFHGRQFVGLLDGVNLSDTALFTDLGDNRFRANRDIPYGDRIIRRGDIIRQETSSYQDIIKVKDMIEKELTYRPHSNILYHLDFKNLSNYSSDEITRLYQTAR